MYLTLPLTSLGLPVQLLALILRSQNSTRCTINAYINSAFDLMCHKLDFSTLLFHCVLPRSVQTAVQS